MRSASRPLIALLVATVALFALWFVALKPGGSTTAKSGAYQAAIQKARQAVVTSNVSNAAAGTLPGAAPANPAAPASAPASSTPGSSTAPPAAATGSAARVSPVSRQAAAAASKAASARLTQVTRALQAHRVVALLFYNPAAADDQAVKQELAAVPTARGSVVKVAVPLAELSSYEVVTNQIQVSFSPTLVLIDRRQQATTIVGFADRFEIAQRVLDALAVK
jgi:hypothetical protein